MSGLDTEKSVRILNSATAFSRVSGHELRTLHPLPGSRLGPPPDARPHRQAIRTHNLCPPFWITVVSMLAFIGCNERHSPPDKNGELGSTGALGEANDKIKDASGAITQLRNGRMHLFSEDTDLQTRLGAIMKQGFTDKDLDDLYLYLKREATTLDFDNTAQFAAKTIMEGADEPARVSRLGLILRCFSESLEHSQLYQNLPAGRLREMSAATTASLFWRSNDLPKMLEFYEQLPLGRDRAIVAKHTGLLSLQLNGIDSALDTISNFEMEEEKILALGEITVSEHFDRARMPPQSIQKLKSLISTFNTRDQKILSQLFNLEKSAK